MSDANLVLPMLMLPTPTMRLKLVNDFGKGEVTYDSGEFDCHSYVFNAYRMIANAVVGIKSGTPATTDSTDNQSPGIHGSWSAADNRTVRYDTHPCKAASGVVTRGLVVGTSAGADSNVLNALIVQILNGSGTDLLDHAAMGEPAYTISTNDRIYVWYRDFNNNHASITPTVNEVGLYANYGSAINYMLIREVLGAPVVVAVSQQLQVTLTLTQTFPAAT